MSSNGTTYEARYRELEAKREPYLQRARECSILTIPGLLPEEDAAEGSDLKSPAQNNGAKGVNSLSAKILLALMPPNIPLFKLETNEVAQKILASQDPAVEEMAREAKENMDRVPRAALLLTETFAHRPVVFEGIKQMVNGGNVLFWMMDAPKDRLGKMRAIPLNRYVVLRDSLGFPLEIIIRDGLNASMLPPKLQAILQSTKTEEELLKEASEKKSGGTAPAYSIYTYACWDPGMRKYKFGQEFMGKIVEGSTALFRAEDCPLVPLRFSTSDCEDYGRGLVEEYFGILQSIEAISQAEAALAIIMSEVKFAVSPSSGIRARDLQNSTQGSYHDVEPGAVQAMSAEKYGDLAAMSRSKEGLQRDFDLAFLVNTAIQRSGERVTAEEIRTMMQLLDSTLGGLYSTLAADFQVPYVNYQLRLLKKTQGIDIGTSGAIRPRVVTGIEALGQSAEFMQFVEACKIISELVGPAAFAQYAQVSGIASRVFGYLNIEPAGLFKGKQEMQQEAAQAAQQDENLRVAPVIAGAAAKAIAQ